MTEYYAPAATTTTSPEEDMMNPETGSVCSFVPRAYQDDDESIYTHREQGNGPHSGKYNGLNHGAKHRKYHDNNGNNNNNNSHFISNDKGHMRIYQYVNRRSLPIEFYMTKYTPGTLIRNAISGIREHKLYVGKKEEYSFFKVKLALSDMGQEQYGTLFYNSPEEYERHFYTTVPQQLKELWMERIMSVHRSTISSTRTNTTTNESSSSSSPSTFSGWFQEHRYKSAPITV